MQYPLQSDEYDVDIFNENFKELDGKIDENYETMSNNMAQKADVSDVEEETSDLREYIDEVESDLNTKINGKAASSHTHTKSQITDFPSSIKNPNAITLKVGSTTTTYDGSAAKSVDINATSVGAATSGHTHSADSISGILPVTKGGTGQSSVDTTPTSGSSKMVTSGGVYAALGKLPVYTGNKSINNNVLNIDAGLTADLSGHIFIIKVAVSHIENDISLESEVNIKIGYTNNTASNRKGDNLKVSDIATGSYVSDFAYLLCYVDEYSTHKVRVINA